MASTVAFAHTEDVVDCEDEVRCRVVLGLKRKEITWFKRAPTLEEMKIKARFTETSGELEVRKETVSSHLFPAST